LGNLARCPIFLTALNLASARRREQYTIRTEPGNARPTADLFPTASTATPISPEQRDDLLVALKPNDANTFPSQAAP